MTELAGARGRGPAPQADGAEETPASTKPTAVEKRVEFNVNEKKHHSGPLCSWRRSSCSTAGVHGRSSEASDQTGGVFVVCVTEDSAVQSPALVTNVNEYFSRETKAT